MNSLSSKSFGCTIVCSEYAKQMLLRHEVFDERSMFKHGGRAGERRTFKRQGLPIEEEGRSSRGWMEESPGANLGSKDCLEVAESEFQRPTPLRTSTEFDVVSVTALDFHRHHCPGAVMQGGEGRSLSRCRQPFPPHRYLVPEGSQGFILHTGY